MLTESMEDYLEMIYRLVQERGYVRAVDISEALQIQASSVTKMIQKLDEAGFIRYEKYRNIALTPLGERYGQFLVWRDATLKQFLILLDAPVAIDEQVEGMEHYITPVTMGLISNLAHFFETNPLVLKEYRSLPKDRELQAYRAFEHLRAWEFRHSSTE